MDDLKKLSVERLRELARKHLGKGHSRLRTRAQLLEALKDVLREPLERLREVAGTIVPAARKKVRVVDFPPGRKGRVRAEPTGAAPSSSARARSRAGRPAEPTAPSVAGRPERTGRAETPRSKPATDRAEAAGKRSEPVRGGTAAGAAKPAPTAPKVAPPSVRRAASADRRSTGSSTAGQAA